MSPTVILVDSFSQIYRGFYAIQGLKNSKGQPTNAVFSIARLLLHIEREYPSEYGAFVFDLGKSEFRLKIHPEYKANRPPMPEELSSQLPFIRDWISAAGWPLLEHQGWEADDIIAGSSLFFNDFNFRIVSSDKDFAQLVSLRTKMLVPDKKGKGFELWSPSDISAKFAVPPEKIVDYLCLVGDSSDNIPGVDGIGPKTAAKLLEKFASVEEMGERPESIENPKLRDKILSSLERLKTNRLLIGLKSGLPDDSWKTPLIFKKKAADWEALAKMAGELEMSSVQKEIIKMKDSFNDLPLFAPAKNTLPTNQFETPDLFNFN